MQSWAHLGDVGFSSPFHPVDSDDSHLIFDLAEAVWTVDVQGRTLQRVVDPFPQKDHDLKELAEESEDFLVPTSKYGFHADIAPDGSRLIYSTCEYESEFTRKLGDPTHTAYEIGTITIGGGHQRRLTESEDLAHFPVWAPDGKSFVYVFSADDLFLRENGQLFLRYVDGSNRTLRLTGPMGVALYPPVWSSDGKYIAFSTHGESSRRVIYTIERDGSGLSRIGESTAQPTWSPDGQVLAFAGNVGKRGDVQIHLASPDGTEIREIWRNEPHDPPGEVKRISWSPDGSELLVVTNHLWTIRPGVSDRRLVTQRKSEFFPGDATWSSDGSMIALFGWDFERTLGSFKVITLDRDGTNLRILAALDAGRGLNATGHHELGKDADVASCSGGTVVPEPDSHRGLVQDCEVLLSARDRLSGTGSLNWGPDKPILEWQGVGVEGSPPRVKSLMLHNSGQSGSIPPELGQLPELVTLDMSTLLGPSSNNLTGVIPPELGSLTKLEVLDVRGNFISGYIPDELAELQELRVLGIEQNFLTGCLPEKLLDTVTSEVAPEPCASKEAVDP